MPKSKITAILGPTNTGKTFSAIKKLLSFKNGVIGFPLRLLARENYNFIKNEVGDDKVALITGEEKIIPEGAKYFLCTVESIPESRSFDFIAIDEVQLAADYERGYLFTEKILNKNGKIETLFLGSNSMQKVLKKIYPDIVIKKQPRFSRLSYCGYKNLSRLPKRSAVIAFSQADVYEIANKIKQAHGGVSVIMGALSPDVRNAQVKLFEDGKVDHIVATDAIGLGLNLKIKNIFFSSLIKFDGFKKRFLTYDEISQIAGRAGRFKDDGLFGTTGRLKSMNDELIKFIENHNFTDLNQIFWRNSKLNFQSPNDLVRSLTKKSEKNYLREKLNASDYKFLKMMLNDSLVKKKVYSQINLKKMWELCGIPDYSHDLEDFHSRFLRRLLFYLIKSPFKIPKLWIESEIKKIKKKTTKIPQLNFKISQVRKWSFLSYKSNWIEKNKDLQKKIKKVESNLSIILHNQLTSQFVGETDYNDYGKKNQNQTKLVYLIKSKIKFGTKEIGEIHGFHFKINSEFKNHNTYNNRILKKYLQSFSADIFLDFLRSNYKEFSFNIDGSLIWRNHIVAKFIKGNEITKPKIKVMSDIYFKNFDAKICLKIRQYFDYLVNKNFDFISKIDSFKKPSKFMRAVIYSIVENLGHCKRKNIDEFFLKISKEEFLFLKKIGLETGTSFYFFETRDKRLKQMLLNIFFSFNEVSFFEKDFYALKRGIDKNKINYLEKIGFYRLSIKKSKYLVNLEYFEKLLKRIFFHRKRNKSDFISKNKFETEMKTNPKLSFF